MIRHRVCFVRVSRSTNPDGYGFVPSMVGPRDGNTVGYERVCSLNCKVFPPLRDFCNFWSKEEVRLQPFVVRHPETVKMCRTFICVIDGKTRSYRKVPTNVSLVGTLPLYNRGRSRFPSKQ